MKNIIKTIDRSALAGQRMKDAYVQAKDKAEHSVYSSESTSEEYATNQMTEAFPLWPVKRYIRWMCRNTASFMARRENSPNDRRIGRLSNPRRHQRRAVHNLPLTHLHPLLLGNEQVRRILQSQCHRVFFRYIQNADSNIRFRQIPFLNNAFNDAADGVDRDGKSNIVDGRFAAGGRIFRICDTDHFSAHIKERTTGISGIDSAVCLQQIHCQRIGSVISRFTALTSPPVREKVSSPRGLPIATTLSPTWTLSESPSVT